MKKAIKKKRGGSRPGSGPKLKYGEPLKMVSIKVPVSKLADFKAKVKEIIGGYFRLFHNC